jgi:hypothetical protein
MSFFSLSPQLVVFSFNFINLFSLLPLYLIDAFKKITYFLTYSSSIDTTTFITLCFTLIKWRNSTLSHVTPNVKNCLPKHTILLHIENPTSKHQEYITLQVRLEVDFLGILFFQKSPYLVFPRSMGVLPLDMQLIVPSNSHAFRSNICYLFIPKKIILNLDQNHPSKWTKNLENNLANHHKFFNVEAINYMSPRWHLGLNNIDGIKSII